MEGQPRHVTQTSFVNVQSKTIIVLLPKVVVKLETVYNFSLADNMDAAK